ncbi:hypothetical protein AB9M75_04160 [Lactobacillus sp. AN1001]
MRRKMTPEEVKSSLKKEIIRLGIDKDPSRTVYQKKYERSVAPSPNYAMKITGMKWQELMTELGFEYDGEKNKMLAMKKNHNHNKAPHYNYDDPTVRKEIMDRVLVAMKNNNYTKPTDLEKNLKKNIDISYGTLKKHGFTWEKIISAYKKKYGEPVVDIGENSKINWTQFTNKELLDMVTRVVKKEKCGSLVDYDEIYRYKYKTPAPAILLRRFNVTYAELWRMIQVNGNLPIK